MPGHIVAIGEPAILAGFRMVGVRVLAAEGPEDVRRIWSELPAGIGLVILTRRAALAVPEYEGRTDGPLVEVLPG